MWLWAPVFFPGWERPSAIHSSVKHNFLYVSNSLNCSWPCSLAQVRGSMCLKAEVPHPALRKLLSQSTASLGTVLCSCTFLHRVSSRGKRDHSSCLGLERMAAFFSSACFVLITAWGRESSFIHLSGGLEGGAMEVNSLKTA